MLEQLIDHSPDLKKLRDEGYNLAIFSNYLILKDIPYVNSNREVKLGILVSELSSAGEKTTTPKDHVVEFAGDIPCDCNGIPLSKIIHSSNHIFITDKIETQYKFSSKPVINGKYADYYDKMTSYINILLSNARTIDANATAQTNPVLITSQDDSVFKYLDSASSRAGINVVSKKLALEKIGIIGLGGTGSYVLDLVAKTHVKEIHLFDGDTFLNHNAFRAPGAASIPDLNYKDKKVIYFEKIYSKMRNGIIVHDSFIDENNIQLLKEMNFVFLCIDANDSKKMIVENLESFDVPFIDTGMDVSIVDNSLIGLIRVTTNTKDKQDHFRNRVSLADAETMNEYAQNIQIADLNCLNATLAVIKWKKLFGFYIDYECEYNSTYSTDCNSLINDEQHEKQSI